MAATPRAKAARSQADIRADALEEEGERLREQLAAAAARHDALAERASRERAEGAAATAAARAEAAAAREEVARARDELLGAPVDLNRAAAGRHDVEEPVRVEVRGRRE